jgi:lipopolysaccharide transport system ATP-binding protein
LAEPIIRVEGLGKQYLLRHQAGGQPRYQALRDTLAAGLRSIGRRWRRRLSATPDADGSREAFWALKDVSFEVAQGEAVGIIGRNGAGKSTLLKLLSRITEPTAGRVELRGRVASLLEVGTGFHPELTGRENVYLNGAIMGMSRAEVRRKFDEIVAFAEVEKFLDTPVKHYSSGMYMRLAFAVAAHLEPEILVVDEVLAVGDVEFQKKCLGKMKDVGQQGRTVLFVSHNLGYINKLCSRAILLEAGAIKTQGDVGQTLEAYMAEAAASPSIVDLSGFRSPYGQGEIQVYAVELDNPVGGRFAVAWDEPIRLRIVLRAKCELNGLSLGVGCQTTDYVPLFTVRTADEPGTVLDFKAGEVKAVTVTIEHNLRAGFYNVLIGIASGNYAYYYCPSAAQLQIMDVGSKPYNDKNTGLINCPARWRVDQHVLP